MQQRQRPNGTRFRDKWASEARAYDPPPVWRRLNCQVMPPQWQDTWNWLSRRDKQAILINLAHLLFRSNHYVLVSKELDYLVDQGFPLDIGHLVNDDLTPRRLARAALHGRHIRTAGQNSGLVIYNLNVRLAEPIREETIPLDMVKGVGHMIMQAWQFDAIAHRKPPRGRALYRVQHSHIAAAQPHVPPEFRDFSSPVEVHVHPIPKWAQKEFAAMYPA